MNMKENWKYKALLIITVILSIMFVISTVQYNRLNNEFTDFKIQTLEQVDSLTILNEQHLKTISLLEEEIQTLDAKADSLEQVKSRIIIKTKDVIISKDISESAELLKKNLSRWDDF